MEAIKKKMQAMKAESTSVGKDGGHQEEDAGDEGGEYKCRQRWRPSRRRCRR